MTPPSPPTDPGELDARLDPESLPRLAFFVGSYLSDEDGPARGSAARAVHEYAAEAELDEMQELESDWQMLRLAARHLPLGRVNQILHQRFGSVWAAASREEIDAIGLDLEAAIRE